MVKFGYKKGDFIQLDIVPGIWIIVCPSPDPGHYLARPLDEIATGLASVLTCGMLDTKVQDIRSWTNSEQELLQWLPSPPPRRLPPPLPPS